MTPACSTAALTKASVAATKAGAGTPAPHRTGLYARVPSRVAKGARLSVCGLIGAGRTARTVRLERRVDGRWVRVSTVRAQRRVVLRGPVVRAPIVVRVTVRDSRGRIVGASGARRVTLKATPKKKRTPKTSAPAPVVPTTPGPAPMLPPGPKPIIDPPAPDPLPGGSVAFETRWRDGGGQIVVTTTVATPGTASALDVNRDAIADFTALVTLTGGKPSVDIMPLGPSAPAAAVEAIISDPEHHVVDRDGLRLGFDAVDGRSPDAFIAAADSGDGLDLAVTQDAPAGQTAPVVAQVFDGTPAAPLDPVELRADGDTLADLRVAATVDRAAGTLGWALTTTAGAPVTVASLDLGTSSATPFANGLRSLRLEVDDATASGLVSADFSHAGTAADPQTVTFTGRDASDQPAGLDGLSFTATGTSALLGRGTVVTGDLQTVPSDLVLDVAHDGTTTTLDATKPGGGAATVGAARIGAAATADAIAFPTSSGNPADGVLLRDRTGDPFVLGVRASDLTRLVTTFGPSTTVDAGSADGPLVVDGDTNAATGRIEAGGAGLSSLDLVADLTSGSIQVAGDSAVEDLSLSYDATAPLALGATSFDAVVAGLGPDTTIAIDGDPHATTGRLTGAEITSDQPVDLRLALAGPSQTATLPAPGTTNTLALDTSVATTTLTARLNDLESVHIRPQAGTLTGTFAGSHDLDAEATVPQLDDNGAPTGVDSTLGVVADGTPSDVALTVAPRAAVDGGGARLAWSGSAASDRLQVTQTGVDLLDGVDRLSADVEGVPAGFTTTLHEPDADATSALLETTVAGATVASGGPRIDELRLAAGSGALPASAGDDKLTYRGGSSHQIALKFTNLKGLSFTPAPLEIALEHEDTLNNGTKPLDLDVSAPSSSAPLNPALGIGGTLKQPSFRTVVTATPEGEAPAKLAFEVTTGSATTPRSMTSLSLTLANAGGSPWTALSLSNLPRTFTGCVAGDAGCVPTAIADLPTALSDFPTAGETACTAPQTANVTLNRPYAPGTSFAFDDAGTSGTSATPSAMVTVNASVSPSGDGTPIALTNVRVHKLRGDLGGGASHFTFKPIVSVSAGDVPRMYVYVDSGSTPFVLNGLSGTDLVSSLQIGTDATPATANKRFAWVAGAVRSSILGCSVGQNIGSARSGTLTCGGQKSMQLNTTLGTVNMFNLPLFGDVTGIC